MVARVDGARLTGLDSSSLTVVSYGVYEIHVQIRLVDRFPSPDELAQRRALERRLGEEVGEISGSGAGGGVADVWVRVAEQATALTRIHQILAALGIAERTRVSARAPEIAIQIRCDEDIFPENGELPTSELVQAIAERDIGACTGVGTSWGHAELRVTTSDPAVAKARIEELVHELGIADCTWLATSVDPEQAWRRVGHGERQTFLLADRSFSTRLRDGVAVRIHRRQRAPTAAEKHAFEQLVKLAGEHGGRLTYDELDDHMPEEASTNDDIDWFLSVLEAKGIELAESRSG